MNPKNSGSYPDMRVRSGKKMEKHDTKDLSTQILVYFPENWQ